MKDLLVRITRPAKIECRACDKKDTRRPVIPARHALVAPAAEGILKGVPSEEYRTFLSIANGARFFHTDDHEHQMTKNGLRILGTAGSPKARSRLLDTLRESMEQDSDDFGSMCAETGVDLAAWYEGFHPVAVPEASGDVIVLDTYSVVSGAEPEVLFLDHEYYYGGLIEPELVELRWKSFRAFITDFADDPIRLLLSNWRYCDGGPMHQFVPNRIAYDD